MSPKIIVNSTPIIALKNTGYLWILKELFGEVIIPDAVYDEVNHKTKLIGDGDDWIIVRSVSDQSDRKMYKAKLHAGEVEVMILAREIDADMVIIDDNEAKKTAKYLGLDVTGTLGVILVAKSRAIITEVAPVIQCLVDDGFYVSDELIRKVLSAAGENADGFRFFE